MGASLPQAPPSEAQRRPEVGSLASWRRPSPTLGTVSSNQKQPSEDETLDSMAARARYPDFASQPHQGGSVHDRGPSRRSLTRVACPLRGLPTAVTSVGLLQHLAFCPPPQRLSQATAGIAGDGDRVHPRVATELSGLPAPPQHPGLAPAMPQSWAQALHTRTPQSWAQAVHTWIPRGGTLGKMKASARRHLTLLCPLPEAGSVLLKGQCTSRWPGHGSQPPRCPRSAPWTHLGAHRSKWR